MREVTRWVVAVALIILTAAALAVALVATSMLAEEGDHGESYYQERTIREVERVPAVLRF